MERSQLTIDELIIETMEALISAGLKSTSGWGSYQRYYKTISKFFHQSGVTQYDADTITAYLKMVDERYERQEITYQYYLNLHHVAKVLVDYASEDVIISTRRPNGTKFRLCERYEAILADYLKSQAFHPNTSDDIEWAIRRFFYYLEQIGHFSLHTVKEEHIRRFIISMSQQMTDGSLKNVLSYLNEFSAFLHKEGLCDVNYIPLFSAKIRREYKIRSYLTDDELRRILAQIDTSTIRGKRDMAMIRLGITTGLRAVDIINLRLCDIDWMKGEIKLIQSKTGASVALPLLPEAGEAIKEYILSGRPESPSDFIFLTTKYPVRKLADGTSLGYVFEKYEQLAGIRRAAFDGKGFHALRRTVARKMVISGVPITTISQILGHLELDSAKQYLSFDSANLKLCALDFSGIEMEGGALFHE